MYIIVAIVVGLLFLGGCTACSVAGAVKSTQNNLMDLQQGVHLGESAYDGALDIVTQKVAGSWTVLDRYLDHESDIYVNLADARRRFDESLAGDNELDQVAAALEYSQAFLTVSVEDNPEIASVLVAENSQHAVEEAVNEVYAAFRDWQDQVFAYNSYRGKYWTPVIVGGMLGFPQSYQYYEGYTEKLDIGEYMQDD